MRRRRLIGVYRGLSIWRPWLRFEVMSAATARGGSTKTRPRRKVADRGDQHNRGEQFCRGCSTGGANQFFGCLDHRVPLCKAARSVQRRLLKPRECATGVPYWPKGRCARCGCATSEEAMTTFDKREEGFEKQFAHDEELRFK